MAEHRHTTKMAEEGLPLVSIVLATYNGEKYLVQQLNSLFAQTYSHLEIIAVDDVSADNTVAILQQYAQLHPNMQVHVNPRNLGFIKNFEKGCTLSTGEFIAFCDQDDYWEKEKIAKLVNAIGDHLVVYSNSAICDENLQPTGRNISDLVHFKAWNNCLQLAVFCRIYAHTLLFTKAFFEQAQPFLPVIPPDWWLPYLSTFGGGMVYYPEALVRYRQHSENVTGVIGNKSKNQQTVSRAQRKYSDLEKIRIRMQAFYQQCPETQPHEKAVLGELVKTYRSFSLVNNVKRVRLFLRYRDLFLSVKKQSALHRFFFCFKMFFKIK